jgi:hypothetical protein
MWANCARLRPLASEDGHGLIEVLLVVALVPVVLGAVLLFGETTFRLAPRDHEQALVARETQVGIHRMTRELRAAHEVHTATASTIDVNVLVRGTNTRVRYDCAIPHPGEATYRRCVRYVVAADSTTGPGDVVVDRVLSLGGSSPTSPVFTYETNAVGQVSYVRVRVEVPARGDLKVGHRHRIALHDGFFLRNTDA